MPFSGFGMVIFFVSFCVVLSRFHLLPDESWKGKTDDLSFKQDLWDCHLKGTRKELVT